MQGIYFMQILAMSAAVRNACISRDLDFAEELLTQEIETDPDNYISYANRAIVMARKSDWNKAFHDAQKVSALRL